MSGWEHKGGGRIDLFEKKSSGWGSFFAVIGVIFVALMVVGAIVG